MFTILLPQLVDDIAATLGVRRADLNVVSTSSDVAVTRLNPGNSEPPQKASYPDLASLCIFTVQKSPSRLALLR